MALRSRRASGLDVRRFSLVPESRNGGSPQAGLHEMPRISETVGARPLQQAGVCHLRGDFCFRSTPKAYVHLAKRLEEAYDWVSTSLNELYVTATSEDFRLGMSQKPSPIGPREAEGSTAGAPTSPSIPRASLSEIRGQIGPRELACRAFTPHSGGV